MEDKKMMMYHGKNWYMIIGTVAIVYGIMNWAMMAYGWPAYMAWIIGGIILLVIGWVKKMMKMGMYANWKM
jgi:membrane-bound ClpP family serine protease